MNRGDFIAQIIALVEAGPVPAEGPRRATLVALMLQGEKDGVVPDEDELQVELRKADPALFQSALALAAIQGLVGEWDDLIEDAQADL